MSMGSSHKIVPLKFATVFEGNMSIQLLLDVSLNLFYQCNVFFIYPTIEFCWVIFPAHEILFVSVSCS
jgi:hypothetical protein